jgi:Helix-turn-helix domain
LFFQEPFPSYETIAEKAHCDRATVSKAIKALEDADVLTWVNRIARIREWGPDLFGRALNAGASSGRATPTLNQDLNLLLPTTRPWRKAVQQLGSEVKGERCRA